jgi:CheY-like chemotaxis protein/class 3 adenylate cyclase
MLFSNYVCGDIFHIDVFFYLFHQLKATLRFFYVKEFTRKKSRKTASMRARILIADDVSAIRNFITGTLHSLDPFLEFIEAEDGREACQKAVNQQPDLIIMDLDMPKMNGLEALIRLKRTPETKHIPVIICSTLNDSSHIKSANTHGAVDFINKPILEHELIARVSSALTLRRTLQELKRQSEKLFIEKQKTEKILKALLPQKIIQDIKKTGYSVPRKYTNVVVIFIDLVDFTAKTNSMSPRRLIKELNELYTHFDAVINKNNCTRIKTVGDAYLATCGLPEVNHTPIACAANAVLEIRNYIINRNRENGTQWEVRIGMYKGDVIGSLVSLSNFTFDIFGNTVNMASRYQTICDPMQINIPKDIKEELEKEFKIIERLPKRVKGQGIMPMYYLHHPLTTIKTIKKDEHQRMPVHLS